MKIIIRMPNWIGDLVMATPILADLRIQFKEAEITAMCVSPLSTLLEKDPHIDALFSFTKPSKLSRRQETRDIVGRIKSGNYDLGILLTNSFSSAWWFWLGGVKKRIGFRDHFRSLLLTQAVPFPENKDNQHLVYTYKALLKETPSSSSTPKLYLGGEESVQAQKRLHSLNVSSSLKIVGINPGAAYGSAKCWPKEKFKALAQELLKKETFLIFFGDKSSKSLIQEISEQLGPRCLNLAGQTTLRECAALISQCALFITNDSGPMHMAAALDVPLIALFGSTNPRTTGPFSEKAKVFYKKVECSPCHLRVCPIDFRCMQRISVEEVAKEALRILYD